MSAKTLLEVFKENDLFGLDREYSPDGLWREAGRMCIGDFWELVAKFDTPQWDAERQLSLLRSEDMSWAAGRLRQRQSLSMRSKLELTRTRIKATYHTFDGQVYVSFSGGIDSHVLLYITRQLFRDVPIVFVNTGVEWPENIKVVRATPGVTWLQPKKRFPEIIQQYGYPVISKDVAQKVYDLQRSPSEKLRQIRLQGDVKGNGKLSKCWQHLVDMPFPISHKCCDILKKQPVKAYEKQTSRVPLIGVRCDESRNREVEYLKRGGCNMFEGQRPKSEPLAFWTKADIWAYAKEFGLEYSRLYDLGWTQTGCFPCLFGVQYEASDLFAQNRFQRMRETHPKLYQYCMETLGLREVLTCLGLNC